MESESFVLCGSRGKKLLQICIKCRLCMYVNLFILFVLHLQISSYLSNVLYLLAACWMISEIVLTFCFFFLAWEAEWRTLHTWVSAEVHNGSLASGELSYNILLLLLLFFFFVERLGEGGTKEREKIKPCIIFCLPVFVCR